MHPLIAAIKPSRTGGLLNRLTWVASFLFILFCAMAIVLTLVNPSSNVTSSSDVTLRAAPGNSKVQMFDELRDGPNLKVTTFNNGYQCSKVSDLLRLGEGDAAMFFYKLNCGGKVGYVNAKWVRLY